MKSIRDAFEAFMQSDVYRAILIGTQVKTNCTLPTSNLRVELFHDGTYRILWQAEIGNEYKSPGLIMDITPLRYLEWEYIYKLVGFSAVIGKRELEQAKREGTFYRAITIMRRRFNDSLNEF